MKPREEGGVVDARLNVYGKSCQKRYASPAVIVSFRHSELEVYRLEHLPCTFLPLIRKPCDSFAGRTTSVPTLIQLRCWSVRRELISFVKNSVGTRGLARHLNF